MQSRIEYTIGIAVGAAEGLVVPVLRNADRLSLGATVGGMRTGAETQSIAMHSR